MAHFERIRDVISGPFSSEIIGQRTAAGWQLVSIEWRRELPDSEAPTEGAFSEDIPYGLRISDDCQRLEIEPTENQALILMMDLLGQDFSYSHIVSDLNEKGFRTRDSKPWSRVAVFNMMPREMPFGGGQRDEAERRDAGLAERRKGHEADAEQHDHHDRRSDIRHIVQQPRQHAEDDGIRQPDQPGADGDDDAERRVDETSPPSDSRRDYARCRA